MWTKTVGDEEEEVNVRKEGFEVPYLKIMMKRHDAVEDGYIRLDVYKRALRSGDNDPDILSKYARHMRSKRDNDKSSRFTSKERSRDILTAIIRVLCIVGQNHGLIPRTNEDIPEIKTGYLTKQCIKSTKQLRDELNALNDKDNRFFQCLLYSMGRRAKPGYHHIYNLSDKTSVKKAPRYLALNRF